MATIIVHVLEIIVAFGLLNVWLLRAQKSTPYRGRDAKNIVEEFAVYGLPKWFCYFIGFLKIGSAVLLLAGIIFPVLQLPASLLITALMIGAVAMHIKVGDPIIKSTPAALMLLMSLIITTSFLI